MEIVLNSDNFTSEVEQSSVPILVDFWASWCGPCKLMDPVLKEVAHHFDGQLKVGKVNVDDQAELAQRFSIVSIPTLILFKGGEKKDQLVGAVSRQKIDAFLESYID